MPTNMHCFLSEFQSIARIHEANLKKHGMLALMFVDPQDYARVQGSDRISLPNINAELDGVCRIWFERYDLYL